jgi:hypothetical protein
MPMSRSRYRIWMAMALVAVSGLAMGAYRERERARLERVRAARARLSQGIGFRCSVAAMAGEIKVKSLKEQNRRPAALPYPGGDPPGPDDSRLSPSPLPCPSPESASGPR